MEGLLFEICFLGFELTCLPHSQVSRTNWWSDLPITGISRVLACRAVRRERIALRANLEMQMLVKHHVKRHSLRKRTGHSNMTSLVHIHVLVTSEHRLHVPPPSACLTQTLPSIACPT